MEVERNDSDRGTVVALDSSLRCENMCHLHPASSGSSGGPSDSSVTPSTATPRRNAWTPEEAASAISRAWLKKREADTSAFEALVKLVVTARWVAASTVQRHWKLSRDIIRVKRRKQ
eukprot:GHVU01027063.1.p1 GENE.GHVU01027063.1~~GHVU01027063.1.p1  ORF type:complete len:117 (+),score=14.82 GHVU01027063.1:493-843(+)